MKTSTTSTELNPENSTPTTTENDLGVQDVTPADLGYDDEPATPPAAPAAPATPAPAKPATPPATPVTGYVKPAAPATPPAEPAAPATPPAEPAKTDEPAQETPEQKLAKDIEAAVSTLGDGYNKKAISEFATKNKLSKEQIDAYVAQVKSDEAAEAQARTARIEKAKNDNIQELMNDKEFGGENFDNSVHEVETLLDKYLPNTKKQLTEKKGMLPPYIMKDLLAVAKALKPTNQFTGGEPPAPKEESDNYLDDMYS